MIKMNVIIANNTGLHARPASELVKLCKRFHSDMQIQSKDADANPKNLISVLSGGFIKGMEIEFTVEGEDEVEAAKEIKKYMDNLIS